MKTAGEKRRLKELKRRKKKTSKKNEKTTPKANIKNYLENKKIELQNQESNDFSKRIEDLENLFSEFDSEECAYALLIFELWLPNVSSTIKIQLYSGILASIAPRSNKKTLLISYASFSAFCEQLISKSPAFSMLEDYIPEPDWGEIRFPLNDSLYKIFYGGVVERICDFIDAFKICFASQSDKFMAVTSRNPEVELKQILTCQNILLSENLNQASVDSFKDRITPGYAEIPSIEFWESARHILPTLNLHKLLSPALLSDLSISAGTKDISGVNWENFSEETYGGTWLPKIFIKIDDRYVPTNVRNINWVFLEKWYSLSSKTEKFITSSNQISRKFQQYLQNRIPGFDDNQLDFSIIAPKQPKLRPIPFDAAIQGKSKIFLLKVLDAANEDTDLDQYKSVVTKAREIIDAWDAPSFWFRERNEFLSLESKSGERVKVEIVLLLPMSSTVGGSYLIPRDFQARVVGLTEFLGITDSLRSSVEIERFFSFFDSYKKKFGPFFGVADTLGAFIDSHGVLEEGAANYNLIAIDPHTGSHHRHSIFRKRYDNFPASVPDNIVEAWVKLKSDEYEDPILIKRTHKPAIASCVQFRKTLVFVLVNIEKLEQGDYQLVEVLQECIADTFNQNKEILEASDVFRSIERIIIELGVCNSIKPPSEFQGPSQIEATRDLLLLQRQSEVGTQLTLSLNADLEIVAASLLKATNAKFEVAILDQILQLINPLWATSQSQFRSRLLSREKEPPRFNLDIQKPLVEFPEGIDAEQPTDRHFKVARRRMAHIAKAAGVGEGHFELSDAKLRLNQLRSKMLEDLDAQCKSFDFGHAIPYLLERIEALQNSYWHSVTRIRFSLSHSVDYDRTERLSELRETFLRNHRNYRYLIEKFVALKPSGIEIFDEDIFGELIAFVDWILVIYGASDSLHYGLHPVGLRISHEYTFSVEYPETLAAQEDSFRKLESDDDLELRGNPNDSVNYEGSKTQTLEILDPAFFSDAGFKFSNLLGTLQVLCNWPSLKNIEPAPVYSASHDELFKSVEENLPGIDRQEYEQIIKFLALSREGLVRLIGATEECADIPVWEHNKRGQRFVISPVILVNERSYWGPYSTQKAASIWQGNATAGTLPAAHAFAKTQAALAEIKKSIEKLLVHRAFTISKRFTSLAEMELDLSRRFPGAAYPPELGDYDVLAYLEEKGVLLSIECKDNKPPFCLKDATRLRTEIFGNTPNDPSQIYKIRRRHDFLSVHAGEIVKKLNWPISKNPLRIVSIYVSRRTYWWFHYPPYPVDVSFVRIDELENFIRSI